MPSRHLPACAAVPHTSAQGAQLQVVAMERAVAGPVPGARATRQSAVCPSHPSLQASRPQRNSSCDEPQRVSASLLRPSAHADGAGRASHHRLGAHDILRRNTPAFDAETTWAHGCNKARGRRATNAHAYRARDLTSGHTSLQPTSVREQLTRQQPATRPGRAHNPPCVVARHPKHDAFCARCHAQCGRARG